MYLHTLQLEGEGMHKIIVLSALMAWVVAFWLSFITMRITFYYKVMLSMGCLFCLLIILTCFLIWWYRDSGTEEIGEEEEEV